MAAEAKTFDAIARDRNWTLINAPRRLSGGLMHRMYRMDTPGASYAVKILNPHIMEREDAFSNYAEAERLERILEERRLPILPALSFGGRKMQSALGLYYYVFEYFDGKALNMEEVTVSHAERMGKALFMIHDSGRKEGKMPVSVLSYDMAGRMAALETENREIYMLLKENLPLLSSLSARAQAAACRLPDGLSVCHNDMDKKNVLWRGDEFRIIDLECLSWANPMAELMETALSWSGFEEGNFDPEIFKGFFSGYRGAGGILPDCPAVLYDNCVNRLNWLNYNIDRVLMIGSGEDERETGISETVKSVNELAYHESIREKVVKLFDKF